MKKYLAVAACVVVAGLASPIYAKTYDCKVAEAGSGDNKGIAPHIIVTAKNGRITVIDGLIQNLKGKPVAAKVAINNAKRTTFTWTLEQVKGEVSQSTASRPARLVFRLTYLKSNGKAVVSMTPVGYANTFRATGKCKVK